MPKRALGLENNQEAMVGTGKGGMMDCDDARTPVTNAPGRGLAHGDYTVGWICAITTEYVAAQAFLDEKHDGPEYVSPNDNNNYTLGKIGKHNIVIAVLPDGEYGTSSAAGIARDMLHSFPNIRIGLMVGIGGGAPSRKHDIRLGDIVVSAPHDGEAGVFQYDFGKTIQNQSFQHTRFLNQSPTVLRTAVNGLKAQYESEGHQLEAAINTALDKKPRLRKKYKRPDSSSDRLYQSGVTHPPNNQADCATACGDDPSKLVLRPERTEDEDNPAIHNGLIASANQLMKDASVRDKLATEKDVLCFEMEAAGLMNHFPCLVVRGICDYSDSHKNKEWQGYAAMVAAAFTKDLLYHILPNRLEAEKRISDVIRSEFSELRISNRETRDAVKNLDIEHKQGKIDSWLEAPNISVNYHKALEQRHKGTGRWFLENKIFKEWKTQPNTVVWLYGIPGCGKTILSATIIEHLERIIPPSQSLLYFYFDFSDIRMQSLDNMVRSLIRQLYDRSDTTRTQVDLLFSSCKNGRQQPRSESLCEILLHSIKQIDGVWIILDALDECKTRKGNRTEGLLSWIRGLLDSELKNVHLLVTSRPERDIKMALEARMRKECIVDIQSNLVTDDIHAYIHAKVREGDGLQRWQGLPEVQDEIESQLAAKANGMFRWVACQIDALENCLDYPSLQNTLAVLPDTLDETYSRILKSIPTSYIQKTVRILQFLVFSERPLRLEECIDAIAVELKASPRFNPKNRMPVQEEIVGFCSSLAILVYSKDQITGKEIKELRLAHFSVKEYLTSNSNSIGNSLHPYFGETLARASIANVCLAYLMHLDQKFLAKEVREMFPFARYCAQYWMTHAIAGEEDETLQGLIKDFFLWHKLSYRNCYQLYSPDTPWKAWWDGQVAANPPVELYYVSLVGLHSAVQMLLDQGANVNVQGGRYGNALQAASCGGHKRIVKLLLEKGANVNAQGGAYDNALYAASSEGHEQIVRLLLDRGANIDVQGGEYKNALWAASDKGHEHIVKLLLDKGAKVSVRGGEYGNALYTASDKGHKQIVELLLNNGANVDAQGVWYDNALLAASDKGHEQVVKLLLDKGPNVNTKNIWYSNALQVASDKGHEQIVKLLLNKGVSIHGGALYAASDKGHEHIVKLLLHKGASVCDNALQIASSKGREQIVKLLLDNGANVNAQGREYGSVLQAASYGGHEHIVKLLLDKGANVNAQDEEYGNALYAASYNGHGQIVKLLLDKGANVNTQGGEYGNALQAALFGGHEQIVKLLLENGANVNIQGGLYGNALSAASCKGYERIVGLLLDKGANVNAQDREHHSALYAALSIGHKQTVKKLLDKGTNVNSQGGWYGNALRAASDNGHEQVVKLLLDKGADIDAQGGDYGNALYAASSGGRKRIVKLLLDRGANVNIQGGLYGNALHAASRKGYEQIVGLLLDKGANVNAQGGEYGSVLQAASYGGHEHIVKLLLDKGANVNAQDEKHGNALYAASHKGHEQIVKLLLDKGADVNTQDGEYDNALQAALFGGHEQIVKLLLDKGANASVQDEWYNDVLQEASDRGHKQIVKLLLDKGANVNVQDEWYDNALQRASSKGYEQIVNLLLDKGANVNAQDREDGNALYAASYNGHEQIVKLLLDNGADVNIQGGWLGNALQAASCKGYEQIVKLLLDKGANVNMQGGEYISALCVASDGGHEQIVKLLLDKGASIHDNALYGASYRGHERIVELLLDKGANVNAQGGKYSNALYAASDKGHRQIVKLLLDKGANVNMQGGEYSNALQAALFGGHKQIVKLLLDNGAIDVRGRNFGNMF